MKIYYTSKDIEELAANGVKQIEINSEVTLTDFARETAAQLGIEMVRTGAQGTATAAPSQQRSASSSAAKVNAFSGKPKGCMHGNSRPAASRSTSRSQNSGAVNDLVNLVGKMIEQGD